ncbi:MAG: ABC transporter ATP-binding protein [Candidatus Eisenbacteria bacterium]|nr:ABC transporter ATP-binding protein [Candidatus Eisenbacteria bacterium]
MTAPQATTPVPPRRPLSHLTPYVRRERAGLALAMAAAVGVAATEVLQPWPLKLVFDYALRLHPHAARAAFLRFLQDWPVDRVLLLAAAMLAVVAVLRGVFGFTQTFYLSRAGQRIVTALRERTFDHLQSLSLAFHRRSRAGDLLVRLTGDINVLSDVLVQSSVEASGRLLQVAGMAAAMLWMDAPLTLAALAVLPFVVWVVAHYTRLIREATRAQRRRESAIASRAGEAIAHIAVVKAFTREDEEGRRFAAESGAVLTAGVRAGRMESAMQRAVEVLTALGTGAVVWMGAHRVLAGMLSPGDLLVFAAYLRQMYRPIRDVANMVNRISKAHACAERVADILEVQPEVVERRGAQAASRFRGGVEFEGVSFAYRPGEPVLEEISFRIPSGARVAVVGPTGSGKSTLVGFLPRFHDPTTGCVRVDGHDLGAFTLRSVREQVSLVLQDAMLFGSTIRDNIAYGRAPTGGGSGATQPEIEAAARVAHIHDFVVSLPEGYDTVVGERGATLSGGQKQRVAVARAVLRDAPILVLDEPTSGLDAESEAAVHAALERLMQGRTTFLITHRLSAVTAADWILVLDRGRLAGQGTHAELLAGCPLYRRLVEHELAGHASLAV